MGHWGLDDSSPSKEPFSSPFIIEVILIGGSLHSLVLATTSLFRLPPGRPSRPKHPHIANQSYVPYTPAPSCVPPYKLGPSIALPRISSFRIEPLPSQKILLGGTI